MAGLLELEQRGVAGEGTCKVFCSLCVEMVVAEAAKRAPATQAGKWECIPMSWGADVDEISH
jgi:hypothetical protein